MKKFNYFYRVENLINGNFYYGVHKTYNLEDGYLGSGKRILYAIKKYGKENFKKEILLFFDTYKEALNYESEIVTEELILDPSCYNLALGGKSDTGFLRQGPALIEKTTGNIIKPKNIEEYTCLFNTGNYYGHTKGKTLYKSGDGKVYCLDKNDNKIQELNLHGIHYDKLMCKDKDGNVYWVDRDDERYLNGMLTLFWKDRKQSNEHKEKCKNTFERIKHQQGKRNSQYGTQWITNEKENKKIKKGDKIPNGWRLGRKIKGEGTGR